MAVERTFLDASRPALPQAARWLIARHLGVKGDAIDLSKALIVLPGGRAGRRLTELLVQQSEEAGAVLFPPRVVTVGALGGMLAEGPGREANECERTLAWVEALREADPQTLGEIGLWVAEGEASVAWAQQFDRLHMALAGEVLGFADVAVRGRDLSGFADEDRWAAMAVVQQKYLEKLAAAGLLDPQHKRRDAIARGACRWDGEIYLVGVVELTGQLRLMLDQLKVPVVALVHGSQSMGDRFDDYGCIRPAAWEAAEIEIDPAQLRVVHRPADQACAAIEAIEAQGGRCGVSDVVIGVCDDQVTSHLVQQLSSCAVTVRDAAGTPIERTGPCRLLGMVADYLDSRSFHDFAALVRHPDLKDWLLIGGDPPMPPEAVDSWVIALDRYYNTHLESRITERWACLEGPGSEMTRIHAAIHHEKLLGGLEGERRLSQWAQPIVNVLLAVYGGSPIDRTDPGGRLSVEACETLHQSLLAFAALGPTLDRPCKSMQAIRLLLSLASGSGVPPEADEDAVELLGPLELHLDDAEVMVVTGVNEGRFPESVDADPFLPNSLRGFLGLIDNARRYARDAYALGAILASRPRGSVTLIAGRQTTGGDPLKPSRLLFATDAQTISSRVQQFFGSTAVRVGRARIGLTPGGSRLFRMPPAPDHVEFAAIRVTDFKAYLDCPYRFYLSRGLRLRPIDDGAAEMDPRTFGDVAHLVLKAFGERQRDGGCLTEPRAIERVLMESLEEVAGRRFGTDPLPAVRIQRAHLEARLKSFATWQAAWAAEGWRIRFVEQEFKHADAAFDIDGKAVLLHGKIDRIDHHPVTDAWAVFDYKVGEDPDTPEKAHRRGRSKKDRTWTDLQLPLYRRLCRTLRDAKGGPLIGPPQLDAMKLGYIRLGADEGCCGASWADWTSDDFDDAEQRAQEIVRLIVSQAFELSEKGGAGRSDEFAAICGVDQVPPPPDAAGREEDPS